MLLYFIKILVCGVLFIFKFVYFVWIELIVLIKFFFNKWYNVCKLLLSFFELFKLYIL